MRIQDEYRVRDALRKLKYFKINSFVDQIVDEVQQIDPIMDYKEFKRFVIKRIRSKDHPGQLSKKEFGCEGLLYGHRNAFFEYAGVETSEQRYLFPYFEHGADLRERGIANILEPLNHSFVFQAPYKNKTVHRERPLSPVYNIGPYILYARPYYDDHRSKSLKCELGKTALLFPAHTFEGASVEFDKKKFVKDVFSKFKDQYDSIVICVYWMDVDDPIYDVFEAEGAKLVSAGFRSDPLFIVRQRTLYGLADIVASNLVGSYIGYSMALDKPFYMFDDGAILDSPENVGTQEQELQYSRTKKRIFSAFSTLTPSDAQMSEQRDIFEHFWGGKDVFKSREEARSIITLSQKLLRAAKYTTKGYEHAVHNALLNGKSLGLDQMEIKILQQAVGR